MMNNYSGYILYVMDTETTGLDPDKHDIIEISMCRLSLDKPDEREQKTWYIKPLSPTTIDDGALRVNGHKKEDILHMTKFGKETYLDPKEVLCQIENWILEDDVSAIDRAAGGQNINFDIEMLKAFWEKLGCQDSFPFSVENGNRMFDTKGFTMAIDLCTGRRRRYYNLSSLVKSFKVKKRKAHRAEDDVAMTVDLLVKMLEPLKEVIANSFNECYNDDDDM